MTKHSISYTLEQIWLLPPFVWQWLALKLLPTLEIVACHSCHLMLSHKPGYPVCQSNISLVPVGRSATSYSHKCLQTNCKTFKMSICRIMNNNAFGVEFLWKITVQLKAIPLFCTAHHLLSITLRRHMWRWFSVAGWREVTKATNVFCFCIVIMLPSWS